MAKIIITEFIDQSAVNDLAADYDVVYDPALVDQPNRLMELISDAPALIVRNRTQVRGALLEAAASLRVIGRLGVGLDNIDIAAGSPSARRQEQTMSRLLNTLSPQ